MYADTYEKEPGGMLRLITHIVVQSTSIRVSMFASSCLES